MPSLDICGKDRPVFDNRDMQYKIETAFSIVKVPKQWHRINYAAYLRSCLSTVIMLSLCLSTLIMESLRSDWVTTIKYFLSLSNMI